MIRLDGKTALVTGAGSGIGQCIAETFARAGARVLVAELRAEAGETTVARIRETGGQAEAVAVDVTSEADLEAAAARHPGVDILVCNAGIQHRKPLPEWQMADWERVVSVNLSSCFAMAQAAARHMVAAGRGRIARATGRWTRAIRATAAWPR